MATVHDGARDKVSFEFDGVCTLVLSNADTVGEIRMLEVQGHMPTLLVPRSADPTTRSSESKGTPDAVVVVDGIECGVWSLMNYEVTVSSAGPLTVDVGAGWTSILKLLQLTDSRRGLAAVAPPNNARVALAAGHLSAVEPDGENKAAEFQVKSGGEQIAPMRAYAGRILWTVPTAADTTLELRLTQQGGTAKTVTIERGSVARITNLCFQPGAADVLQHYRVVGIDPASLTLEQKPGLRPWTVYPYDITCGCGVYRS